MAETTDLGSLLEELQPQVDDIQADFMPNYSDSSPSFGN
jgi:hypothetical protein